MQWIMPLHPRGSFNLHDLKKSCLKGHVIAMGLVGMIGMKARSVLHKGLLVCRSRGLVNLGGFKV